MSSDSHSDPGRRPASGAARRPGPRTAQQAILERRVAWTRLSLIWEQVWPRLALAFGVVALFAILSLFNLWRLLGGWGHALALALFALALAAALVWAIVTVRWPTRAEARRRLEQTNGLDHRPLATLQDSLDPAEPEGSEARALWAEHQRRVAERLRRVRPPLPQAGWARIDPWGLRAAFGLVLVVALGFAGWRIPHLMSDAFRPTFAVAETALPAVEGWITPPAYTQAAPIFLTKDGVPVLGADGWLATSRPAAWRMAAGEDSDPTEAATAEGEPVDPAEMPGRGAIAVPQGSTLTLRVANAPQALDLELDGARHPFEQIDPTNQQVELPIESGRSLAVMAGEDLLARWRIAVRKDQVPEIAFADQPVGTARDALQMHYAARDDYGLSEVAAEIVPTDEPGQKMALDLPLPGLRPVKAKDLSFHDLTAHPWAGREVGITLTARDEADQVGRSETVTMVLPQRIFTHPVAQALVEQRRELAHGEPPIDRVELALDSISSIPDSFDHDPVVSLALGVSTARLRHGSGDPESLSGIQDLLWDTALRLEDGDLSLAERALRSAQRRLMEALARNATDAEIEKLMRELREAMDKFLQAMTEQALRNMDELSEIPSEDLQSRMLGSEQLRRMLERAEDLAKGGARDAARDMLSELNRMLESLKQGRVMADPRGAMQGQRTLEELSEILRDQQQLLDRSFRQSQRGQQGQQGQRGQQGEQGQMGQQGQRGRQPGQQPGQGPGSGQGLGGDAQAQEDLRRRLQELLDRLGEGGTPVPDAFGRADQSMGAARDALEGGASGMAAEEQSNALDQLRQGMRGLMDQLADQMNSGGEGEAEAMGQSGADNHDPLGRPMPGEWEDGSSTKVPEEADLQRAREILEELYRRSGERYRPSLELDYIDRLLRRF
ncbi:TIGR02302 family protein [Marinibaculum pumilum]|uniref:TIGR02302 family protein n=1 Tax=Marinibaculum pumilum TaxID=1766165 RepID=A0ABV7L9S6_9PROT